MGLFWENQGGKGLMLLLTGIWIPTLAMMELQAEVCWGRKLVVLPVLVVLQVLAVHQSLWGRFVAVVAVLTLRVEGLDPCRCYAP